MADVGGDEAAATKAPAPEVSKKQQEEQGKAEEGGKSNAVQESQGQEAEVGEKIDETKVVAVLEAKESEEKEGPEAKKKDEAESEKPAAGETKVENGTEKVEGEGEGEGEAKKQPRKRGRPRKEPKEPKAQTPATPAAEKTDGGEETPKSKRGRRKRSETEFSPPIDRPSRERKSIDRFGASSVDTTPRIRELHVKKGAGTALSDIPNVAFKIGRASKNDATLRTLHSVVFAQRSNVTTVKSNVLQFSGFIWEDKEREMSKVKDKLEKLNKEELNDLVDMLDMNIKGRKDELVNKVIEFLESPHATTDVLLAEKESEKKRRGRSPGRPKKQDSDEPPAKGRGRKRKSTAEDDDDHDEESLEEEEEIEQKKTYKETDEEDEDAEDSSAKDTEADSEEKKPATKKRKTDSTPSKVYARKNKKDNEDDDKKEKPARKRGRPRKEKKEKSQNDEVESAAKGPSEEELRAHIRDLYQVVDFQKITFKGVLKMLEDKLHADFTKGSLRNWTKKLMKQELEALPDKEEEVATKQAEEQKTGETATAAGKAEAAETNEKKEDEPATIAAPAAVDKMEVDAPAGEAAAEKKQAASKDVEMVQQASEENKPDEQAGSGAPKDEVMAETGTAAA